MEEYARLTRRFDQRRSFYINATTRETLKRLTLKPGQRLLDIGCGTGAKPPPARLTRYTLQRKILVALRRNIHHNVLGKILKRVRFALDVLLRE